MKKRLSLLLSTIMVLTMLFGSSVSVWAEPEPEPQVIDRIELEIPAYSSGMTAKDIVEGTNITSSYNAARIQGQYYYEGYKCMYEESICLDANEVLTAGKTYTIYFLLGHEGTVSDYKFSSNGTSYNGSLDAYTGSTHYRTSSSLDCNGNPEISITYTIGSTPAPGPAPAPDPEPTPGTHTHNFEYQILKAPSMDCDGEEGEVCTICGAVRNVQTLSAFGYALYGYALPKINAAQPGQTVTFDFGLWNSFPKGIMEKIAAKSAQNVTFVFKYEYNHEKYAVKIPAGTKVDLNHEWYGPAKMMELYGMYK